MNAFIRGYGLHWLILHVVWIALLILWATWLYGAWQDERAYRQQIQSEQHQ